MDCTDQTAFRKVDKTYETLIRTIHKTLSPGRWRHTIGVVKAAEQLARTFGADEEHAVLAAYCHDFTKEWTEQENAVYVKKYKLPGKCLTYPEIAHGHVAAAVLQEQHGIDNEDMLNAIRYHSTGREDMSLLEKIIYLADLIEEGRAYHGIEAIRNLAQSDLDAALTLALREVIDFVRRKGKEPDEASVKALAYLMEQQEN